MTHMPIRRLALSLALFAASACKDGTGGSEAGSSRAAVAPSSDSSLAQAMARINDPERGANLPTEDNSAANINPFRRNWGRAGREAGEAELAVARVEGTEAYVTRIFSDAEAIFAGNTNAASQSVAPQRVRRAVECAALGRSQAEADFITPFEGETLASGWMQAFWAENTRINENNEKRRLTIQPLFSPAEVYALYHIALDDLRAGEVTAAPEAVAACQAELAAVIAAAAAEDTVATPAQPADQ